MMAQMTEVLPAVWKTWILFLAPSFGLAKFSPQPLQSFEGEPVGESALLCSSSASQINK